MAGATILTTLVLSASCFAFAGGIVVGRQDKDRRGRFLRRSWWEQPDVYVLLAVALACIVLFGCQAPHKLPALNTADTGNAIGAAQGHVQNTKALNADLKPHVDDSGVPTLKLQGDEIDKALASLASGREANDKLAEKAAAKDKAYDDLLAKYDKLDSKWYVRWGQRIESWIRWLIIGYVAFGVFSIVAGMSPWPTLQLLGKELVLLLPFANPISWIRRLVNSLRSPKPSETGVTPP